MAIDPSISRNNLNRLREAAIRSALDNVVDDEGDKIQASRTLMAKSPEVKDTAEIKSASNEVQRRLERNSE